MARARGIKPGYYKNEELAECSVWARFIFPGLWMLADREGRLEDRPKRIKGELLPFDAHDVEPLLRELAAHGFIQRYQIGGGKYIQITKFKAHQTPHYSEKPSAIKPPSLQENEADISHQDSGNTPAIKPPDSGNTPPMNPPPLTENSTTGCGELHNRNPLTPSSLTPDCLTPSSPTPEHTHVPSSTTVTDKNTGIACVSFFKFWENYPRKAAKQAAIAAWRNLDPPPELMPQILTALEAQKASAQWRERGAIPNAATWLTGRRWEDEITEGAAGVNGHDLGLCSWNINGNRDGEPRCDKPATTMKNGTAYCAAHSQRVNAWG